MQEHGKKREIWKCLRHSSLNEVLSLENHHVDHVYTATRLDNGQCPNDLFWFPEGAKTGSGFASGPGWIAYANDFPEGTKIRVDTQLILPAQRIEATERPA